MKILALVLCSIVPLHGSQTFTSTANTLIATTGITMPTTGSISVAVFPTYSVTDNQFHIMFESFGTSGINQFSLIKGNTNNLYLEIDNSSGVNVTASASSGAFNLPTSAWTIITATWVNGGVATVYVNAMQVAQSSGTLSWTGTGTQTWSVGNRSSGGFDQRGNEALVGVWNRVLNAWEIIALTLRLTPTTVSTSGLIGEWDLAGSSVASNVGGVSLVSSGTTAGPDPSPFVVAGSGFSWATFF